jgi:hypothetical protein
MVSLLGLLFDLDYGGNTSLRKAGGVYRPAYRYNPEGCAPHSLEIIQFFLRVLSFIWRDIDVAKKAKLSL